MWNCCPAYAGATYNCNQKIIFAPGKSVKFDSTRQIPPCGGIIMNQARRTSQAFNYLKNWKVKFVSVNFLYFPVNFQESNRCWHLLCHNFFIIFTFTRPNLISYPNHNHNLMNYPVSAPASNSRPYRIYIVLSVILILAGAIDWH